MNQGFGFNPTPPWWSGKTGLGVLMTIIGGFMYYFNPDLREFSLGLLSAGAAGMGIGGAHKVKKSME
jgi:hypothetical protein